MMHTIYLSIFTGHFKVVSNNLEIIENLKLDFHYFLAQDELSASQVINISIQEPPWNMIPEMSATSHSDTSITYEKDSTRYNDYHGKALTTVRKDEAHIYCSDNNLAHELGYLLILSKSGKKMDLSGMHKIHAMGLQYENVNLLLISPSKGGKTTHFLSLLKNPKFKIYSDDTPVIDRKGHIYAFPLRVGIEENSSLPVYVDKKDTYQLLRRQYGLKTLIPIHVLKRDLANYDQNQKTILLLGKRSRRSTPELRKAKISETIFSLTKFMIIGVGLPMMLDYFLETGLRDIIRRFKIIFSRSIAAIFLVLKSKIYIMEMSTNFEKNELMINELIKSH